ncbi:HAD hydrolase-like protein [Streptomyces sioyaensis]|uniref:HAD hydrolase-like protein n=1 Tax=Streptomyces sioyaensis TaxID=67364 RepID=UPI0037D55E92
MTFGDSPHADIAGANALGLQSVWGRTGSRGRRTPSGPRTLPRTSPPRSTTSSTRRNRTAIRSAAPARPNL